jgi:hypothetical protein
MAASSAPFNFLKRLKEISLFFQGKDEVHKALRRVTRRLERAGIPYAIVGGMAVNAHKYKRTTADVDLLLTREGLDAFVEKFVTKNYTRKPERLRQFLDRVNKVGVDILVTGLYPGSGKPGPIAYPDPTDVAETIDTVQVVNLLTLIQLKLAARRYRDFSDVVELIRFNNLDEGYLDHLDPSVRSDFIECLEEKRREDEYQARNG